MILLHFCRAKNGRLCREARIAARISISRGTFLKKSAKKNRGNVAKKLKESKTSNLNEELKELLKSMNNRLEKMEKSVAPRANVSVVEYEDLPEKGTSMLSQANKFNQKDTVYLDTAANISIVNKDLLSQMHRVANPLNSNKVGSVKLQAKHTGVLEDFFRCYTSTGAFANVFFLLLMLVLNFPMLDMKGKKIDLWYL